MKKTVLPTLIIKRYENRRLYNTFNQPIHQSGPGMQLVRDGYELRVVDASTGEDLTRPTSWHR